MATNQQRNRRAGYTNNIRLYSHRQQCGGTHANQADQEAAKATAHQPQRSCSHNLTVNRPRASRPTFETVEMETAPTRWPRHGAPRLPMTIPTNKTEHRDSTVTQPTSQH